MSESSCLGWLPAKCPHFWLWKQGDHVYRAAPGLVNLSSFPLIKSRKCREKKFLQRTTQTNKQTKKYRQWWLSFSPLKFVSSSVSADGFFCISVWLHKTRALFHGVTPLSASLSLMKWVLCRKSIGYHRYLGAGSSANHLTTAHFWVSYKLKRQFRLYIPFLGIARPKPQFPHSCACERFIYSLERSTYFLQQKRQTQRGNI